MPAFANTEDLSRFSGLTPSGGGLVRLIGAVYRRSLTRSPFIHFTEILFYVRLRFQPPQPGRRFAGSLPRELQGNRV